MIRKYKLKKRVTEVFPSKCDNCKHFFKTINYFVPEKVTHILDNIQLCDHCIKEIFKDDEEL